MFCAHCGTELKDGSRFCSACGAPVVDMGGMPSEVKPENVGVVAPGLSSDELQGRQNAFASQMESDRKRSRKKLSPLMIIALVLALLAGTALAAVLITQQANQGEEKVEQVSSTATQASESNSAATQGSESSSAAAEPAFDQAKAEAEARAAAEAAGKTVLTGTVFIGTENDWAELEGLSRAPNPDSTIAHVGLVLDEPATVAANHLGGQVVERSGSYVLLNQNDAMDVWGPYEGQRVSVALDGIWAFSDSLGALFAFSGKGERIAPLTEADVATASGAGGLPGDGAGSAGAGAAGAGTSLPGDGAGTAASGSAGASVGTSSGNGSRFISLESSSAGAAGSSIASSATEDYVLADSDTRRYTRAELEKLDLYTLFLARNEVFARHGCGFKKQELRDWFGSKSWYTETIPAGSYGTDLLNDIETDNVNLMKSIEQERNSPYLT